MNDDYNRYGAPQQPGQTPPGGWQSGAYPPVRPSQQQAPQGQQPTRPTYNPQQPGGSYQSRHPQAPYRYSASTGWQQRGPEEKYSWDFAEYDRVSSGPRDKKPKNRGVVMFSVCLLCVLFVGLLAVSGYNLWNSFLNGANPGDGGTVLADGELPEGNGGTEPAGGGNAQLQISSPPPSIESEPISGERMSTTQVARAVRPAVVGVVNYIGGQFFEPYTEGSGIIMTEDGYIITNQHVIAGADALVIVLEDGSEYEAVVVGQDARTDIAVLKVDATGLTPAIFGDSDALEVGETVIAIGNPAGLELAGSVTQGIVSAVNRVIKTPYYSMNYIQTDAAINPGNSGGALCNQFGQVVGINSAKIVADGYEGICFAIPITEAKPIIDDLIQNGRVTGRVLLGITGDPVSDVIANRYNVPQGVQITSITNESLTEAGVMRGDIITHIDGERVLDYNDIRDAIDGRSAGETVTLTIFRQTTATQRSDFDVVVPLIEDGGE